MLEKAKMFLKSAKGKVACAVGSAFAVLAPAANALAADGVDEAVSAAKTLMNSITDTLNIGNIVAIISAGLGACVGLFLAWWGARKLVGMLMKVFRKGKLSL